MPGVGHNIAMHTSPFAREFLPCTHFHLPGPFTFIFFLSKNFSRVFPVLAVANAGSRIGPRNKNRSHCSLSQEIDAGSCVEHTRNVNRLQNVIVLRNSW